VAREPRARRTSPEEAVSPRARWTSPEEAVSPRARRTSPEGATGPRVRRSFARGCLGQLFWWATRATEVAIMLCVFWACKFVCVFTRENGFSPIL
jgi:hypothetical protein